MAGEPTIRRFLVRYGRTGRVGWFGTIHAIDARRNSPVVVVTALGVWPGRVLRVAATGEVPREGLSGELVRLRGDADEPSERAASGMAGTLARAAAALADQQGGNLVVLDAEVDLDGRVGLVHVIGPLTETQGRWSVELAERVGLERVQWMPAEPDDGPIITPGIADEPPSVPRSAQQASGPQSPHRALVRILGTASADTIATEARQHRHELGLVGAYLQKVRDPPAAVRRQWMVRIKATAGGWTAGQMRRMAELATRHGNGTLRLTMRQGIQMHGIAPGEAGEVLAAIDALAMTTRGSCGNSLRNVACCPLPAETPLSRLARQLSASIAHRWMPAADWITWTIEGDPERDWEQPAMDGASAKTEGDASPADPAYPDGYPPHKWKIGVTTAGHNCIDVRSNDLGLVVRHASGQPVVDCYAGGSLGYRPGVTASTAALAEPLFSVLPQDVDRVVAALIAMQREHMANGPRHMKRLKYLVRRLGAEGLRGALRDRLGERIQCGACDADSLVPWEEHPRWTPAADGSWTASVGVVGGRMRVATASGAGSEASEEDGPWVRFASLGRWLNIGPRHTLVVAGIPEERRQEAEELLRGPLAGQVAEEGGGGGPGVARALTCVALPTCPLAVAEAERHELRWRRAADAVAADLKRMGIPCEDRPLTVAVSGCANGCSHPLSADLGIVAEGPRKYRVYVGGDGRNLGRAIGTISSEAQLEELIRGLTS